MADYFGHWLDMGAKMTRSPKLFFVNWFKKDNDGKFIWPGFRDNSRVIKWMVDRIKGHVPARQTPVGLMPRIEDLNLEGLSLPSGVIDKLFETDKGEWQKEAEEIEAFYAQFGDRLPKALKKRLTELKNSFK
jgi:phosphoenolpyruvate carboxykinase (GTP)